MDLNEILSFKPEKPSLKRLADGEPMDPDMRPPHAKQTRGASHGGQNSHGGVAGASVSDEEKLRILQSLEEEDEEEEGEGLDAGGVKRMLLSFEKKVCVPQSTIDVERVAIKASMTLGKEVSRGALHVSCVVKSVIGKRQL